MYRAARPNTYYDVGWFSPNSTTHETTTMSLRTSAVIAAGLICTFVLACSSDEITDPNAPMALAIKVEPVATSISVSDTITTSNTVQLELTATSLGKPVTAPRAEWTSSNTAIAAVDSAGLVRAVGIGSATITARVNGEKATAAITVEHNVALVSLSPTTLSGVVGDTIVVTASALDSKGGLVAGTAYSFASTDATTGAVARTGNRTARIVLLKAGAIGVTVTAAGKSATVTGTATAP